MLSARNISKSFGDFAILQNISFNLNAGERLGLIGPNGCGKTTLLRILAGLERPDSGGVGTNPPEARIGYLPQGDAFLEDETICGFIARMAGDADVLAARLAGLASGLSRDPGKRELQAEYDRVLQALSLAAENAGRIPSTLAALGLRDYPPETPTDILSGGQKTRLALAGVLLSGPHILLLDEPTNHLDLEMLSWLEDWLAGFPHAALVVSHDRAFLDRTATGILELDPRTHAVRYYPGSYSDYAERKAVEYEKQWQRYKDQQDEIERVRQAAQLMRAQAQFKKGGKADQRNRFAKGFYGNRSLAKMRVATRYEDRLEHLRGEGTQEKPRQDWQAKIEFPDLPASGRDVLQFQQAAVGYDTPLLTGLHLVLRQGERVALIGENGTGKTTLLRTIAGTLPVLEGRLRLGSGVRVGYMTQEQESLDPELDVLSTMQREAALSETDARAYLHKYLFTGDEVFRPVGCLSYGERALLMLALLTAGGCNFLLLDEPVNHLDIPSRARFEQALAGYEGTVLAVSHDRCFIAGFASAIWEIKDGSIRDWGYVTDQFREP